MEYLFLICWGYFCLAVFLYALVDTFITFMLLNESSVSYLVVYLPPSFRVLNKFFDGPELE